MNTMVGDRERAERLREKQREHYGVEKERGRCEKTLVKDEEK